MKHLYLTITIFILVFNSNAKANINHKWNDLQYTQYIDNLVNCQLKVKEFEWSHSIWPKENKKIKPDFIDVVKVEDLYDQVVMNLNKQSVLNHSFNTVIDKNMLEADIVRMTKNTKDAKRLKQLFSILGNNPTTIAHCLSRTYLVDKLLLNKYNWSHTIHSETKAKANLELSKYLNSHTLNDISAKNNLITYKITDIKSNNTLDTFDLKNSHTVELGEKEFREKLFKAKSLNLEETSNAFIYSELVAIKPNSMVVRIFQWNKKKFNKWLNNQNITNIDNIVSISEFKIPKINLTNVNKLNNPSSVDKWEIQNMPDARQHHSAVWTGTEMLVWGGYHNSILNTGGRYNPTTDTWIGLNTVNAPEARLAPAVWTGTEMIIWGGTTYLSTQENTVTVNTGSRYNPNTDSWENMDNNPPISNRYGHSMVWTGSNIVIWGGFNNVSYLNTGAIYDPILDSWDTINSIDAPSARTSSNIWTGSEMIIWGGFDGEKFISSGKKYNPNNDSWSAISELNKPVARFGESVVWADDTMIIWGGLDSNYDQLFSGARYSPSLDMWQTTSEVDAPVARYAHSAVWTGSEMILYGGDYVDAAGFKYDPISDTWSPISTVGEPSALRSGHSVVWTGTEMIVWGGYDNQYTNTGGRYNPVNDSWINMGRNNQIGIRKNHSSVWTGNEMIIWGGSLSLEEGLIIEHLQTGGLYNPTTDTWQMTSLINAPIERELHSSIWTGTEMIVLGGKVYLEGTNDVIVTHSSGGRYNPLTDSWLATNEENAPNILVSKSTVVWTGTEAIIWGIDFFDSGGRYNPELDTWQSINIEQAPNVKDYHSAIWTGTEMIVWGGDDTNTGEKYNPANDSWTSISIMNAPTARQNHTSVWTGTNMIIWGGTSGNSLLSSGGIYNPDSDSWILTTNNDAPQARYLHTSIWTGTEMIVWGGARAGSSNVLNTGSYFNPINNSWKEMTLNGAPHARAFHTASWAGEKMMIWGGAVPHISAHSSNSFGIYDIKGNDIVFNNGFEN